MANYTKATGVVLPLEDLLQSTDGAAYVRTRGGMDLQTYLDTLANAIGAGTDFDIDPTVTTLAGISVNNWNTYNTGVEGSLETGLQLKLDDVNNRIHVRVASFASSGAKMHPTFYIEVINAVVNSVTPGPYSTPLSSRSDFKPEPGYINTWGSKGAYLQFTTPYMDSREYVFNLSKLDSSVLVRLYVDSSGVSNGEKAFISLGDEVISVDPQPPLNVLFNTTDAKALGVTWDQITGANKPEDNATAGATWGVDITGENLPADGATVNHTFVQSFSPGHAGIVANDLWINTGEGNKLYTYSFSSGWIARQDQSIGDAILLAEQALEISTNNIRTFLQDTAPVNTEDNVIVGEGDLWFDTDDNNHTYIYFGDEWVSVHSPLIQEAYDKAVEALSKVDNKISTYYTDLSPNTLYRDTLTDGDLWYHPTRQDIRRWNVADNVWQQVANNYSRLSSFQDDTDLGLTAEWDRITGDLKPQDSATRNLVFIQDTPPSSSTEGLQVGDLWINTGDSNRFNVWNGLFWISSSDGKLDDIIQKLDELDLEVGRKNTIFVQAFTPAVPTGGHTRGDIWVNTEEGNVVYAWDNPGSGLQWVNRQDVALTTVVADVDGLLNDSMQSLLDNADTHNRVVTLEGQMATITVQPSLTGASDPAKIQSIIDALLAMGLVVDETT